MLTPQHCAEVSVINAGKGFTPETALADLRGHPTYALTRYMIVRERDGRLRSGDRAAVLEVQTEGDQLVKTIVGGTVVASPEQCMTVVDPTLDEFTVNHVVLRAVAARTRDGVQAVILSGRSENVTFVYLGDHALKLPLKILLVDTVPPRPSRLEMLAKAARAAGQLSDHLHVESVNVDAATLVQEARRGGRLAFTPCPIGEPVDGAPSITSFAAIAERAVRSTPPLSIDLIGCSLSLATLNRVKERRGLNVEATLRDICPLHAARGAAATADTQGFITRCCKTVEGTRVIHFRGKPVLVLPWAPSLGDFMKAVDALVGRVTQLEVV